MISFLETHNYDPHEHTVVEFSPKINVIIGSSDSGKTDIIRQMFWCKENRPSGNSNVSYWNRDKHGKPVEEQSVAIGIEDMVVTRYKKKDTNGYRIEKNGVLIAEPKSIRSDVPQEVEDLFNMNETNLSRQFDQPFLMSASAPEVGRFLNKVIHLEEIDEVLGRAEAKRRELNRALERVELSIEKVQEEIVPFSWLPEAEGLLKMIERKQERINVKEEQYNILQQTIVKWEEAQIIIDSLPPDIPGIFKLMEEVESLSQKTAILEKKYNSLKNSILEYEKQENLISDIKKIPFKEIYDKMSEIITLNNAICDQYEVEDELQAQITLWEKNDALIRKNNEEIEELKKSLPNICPTCNQLLPEGFYA